jgi:ketosteroid isomerase-like protein
LNTSETEVRKVVNAFQEAWNRHDLDAREGLFAPDADFVNVMGHHWKGRQAIQSNFAFLSGIAPADSASVTLPKQAHGIFKTARINFSQIDVRFLREDVAVAHIESTLVGDTRTPNPRRGLLVMILTKDAGRWRISVVQNTNIYRPV